MTAITNKEWDKHFSPEGRVRFWSRAYRPRRLIADMTWDQAIKEREAHFGRMGMQRQGFKAVKVQKP